MTKMDIRMKINTGASKNNHHNLSVLNKKKYNKKGLKIDDNLFMDPIINLTDDKQAEKYHEIVDFCKGMSKCLQCRKDIDLARFCSTPDGGIRALCPDCLNYVTDESQISKDLVRWFNSLISDYGMNFENGFPKLIQYEEKGEWCKDCQDYHVTIHTWDFRE